MNISSIRVNQNYNITGKFGNLDKNEKQHKEIKNNEENKSLKIQPKKNELIENLRKIKQDIIEQKEKLREEDLTPEMRKEKLDQLNKKIFEIEKQIQDAQLAEKQKEAEKVKKANEAKQKKNNASEDIDGVIVDESLKDIISASHNVKNISSLKEIKSNMKVELGYINQAREKIGSINPDSFIEKHRMKLQNGISNLDDSINKEIGKLNKKVKKNIKDTENIKESKDTKDAKEDRYVEKQEKIDNDKKSSDFNLDNNINKEMINLNKKFRESIKNRDNVEKLKGIKEEKNIEQ